MLKELEYQPVIEIDRKSVLDAARLVAAATADPARTVSSGPDSRSLIRPAITSMYSSWL
jgi:hypothetical protein